MRPLAAEGLPGRCEIGLLPALGAPYAPGPYQKSKNSRHMITGYFAYEIRRLNRNLARLGLLLLTLAILWTIALERPYWRRLAAPATDSAGEDRAQEEALAGAGRWWPVPFIPGVLAASGAFCLGRALRRSMSLGAHPLARSLARSPACASLEEVEAKLDEGWTVRAPIRFGFPFGMGNWSTTGKYRHHSAIRIGPGWFYYGCTLQADLCCLEDLVWFYRLDRALRSHGVELGTAHQLVLRFRDGGQLLVSLGETESLLSHRIGKLVQHLPNAAPFAGMSDDKRIDVLYALQCLAPWAIAGHDEAMERVWQNPKTRNNILALVERRKHSPGSAA